MVALLQFPAIAATTLLFAFATQTTALPSNYRLETRATLDLPTGWTDAGCVKDYSARILSAYQTSSSTMTPRFCANTCRGLGYVSFGLHSSKFSVEANAEYTLALNIIVVVGNSKRCPVFLRELRLCVSLELRSILLLP
jgi:hypothetical protein